MSEVGPPVQASNGITVGPQTPAKPKAWRVKDYFKFSLATLVGLIAILIIPHNASGGATLLAMAIILIYAMWRSHQAGAKAIWHIVSVFVGWIFIAGGLMIVAFAMLLVLAFSSWGGGGGGELGGSK